MSVIIRERGGYGRKLIAGILLIAAAVCMLLTQLKIELPFLKDLGALTKLGSWEIVGVVVCVLIFIGGIVDLEPWQITFPAGIVYCIIDEPLGLPVVEFWPMMLIAFILTIGLGFLIPEGSFVTYKYTKHVDKREAKEAVREAAGEAKEAAREAKEAAKEAVKAGKVMDVDYREVNAGNSNENDSSSEE